MKIKHSKYKNTGILFELLVRQATSDTLNGTDSAAIDLIKRFFVKSELGREYKLYESVVKSNVLTESKASTIVTTILETSQKLNRTSLRKQKYNLINEIKKHYDLNSFFGAKLKNYKELASIYTLIESYNNKEITDTDQIIDNKIISAIEEERLIRQKRTRKFPIESINYCLSSAKIKLSDLTAIAISWNPSINLEKFNSNMSQNLNYIPSMLHSTINYLMKDQKINKDNF